MRATAPTPKTFTAKNDPSLKGAVAGPKRFFGPYSRFALYPIHTRFDDFAWVVEDAETLFEGLPDMFIFLNEAEALAYVERRATEAEAAEPADPYAD